MKSFLLKNGKKPILKWGMLSEETYFEGELPDGFSLAVSPSKEYVVIDVDRHGNIDGFDNIPEYIKKELKKTFNYGTKNNGRHYWVKYTGNRKLANKTSGLGIDLRVGPKKENNGKINSGGYVVWYPETDPRECMHLVNKSSKNLNIWIERLFSYQ